MWLYWLMFAIPAFATAVPRRLPKREAGIMWVAVGLLFALLIGLRHEVGGDWFNYLRHFGYVTPSLVDILPLGDPGYYGLNWLVAQLDGTIYHVNFVCASILMWGTVVFCRAQPNSWLALLVAVPYMLIVVGMGYTRQSAALGFALLALVAISDGRIRGFILWVVLGATFHKSAVLLLPIAGLAASRNRLVTGSLVALTTVLVYYLMLADSSELLWERYVDSGYQSEGGLVRVLMNVVPAVFLIAFRRRLVRDAQEQVLWLWIAAFALACLPLLWVASTAIDRIALYLIPIQLYVFTRLPQLANRRSSRTQIVLAVVAFYALVQAVWLNFAIHAEHWLPYRFVLFV